MQLICKRWLIVAFHDSIVYLKILLIPKLCFSDICVLYEVLSLDNFCVKNYTWGYKQYQIQDRYEWVKHSIWPVTSHTPISSVRKWRKKNPKIEIA